jgi:tetratricopeptide (TPR) repeat protein
VAQQWSVAQSELYGRSPLSHRPLATSHYPLTTSHRLHVHRLIPLYSHFQLPIIVVMRICFKIGAEQDGASPVENRGNLLRTGAACCARCSLTAKSGPLADSRSPSAISSPPLIQAQSTRPRTAPARTDPREDEWSFQTGLATSNRLSQGDFGESFWSQNRISNRNWSKNRSYTKQTTKPCLTGTRIALKGSDFVAQFLRFSCDRTPDGDSFSAALRISRRLLPALLLLFVAAAIPLAARPSRAAILTSATVSPQQSSIPELFGSGEAALRAGNLDQAESSFKQVLALDPNSAGAYANLGVIAMRRQNWSAALDLLHKAERLAPNIAGIRLNIGLVHYRQSEFKIAIGPFESVVRDKPDSVQARYLLGLCYFFTERYADAVHVLQDLWPQESNDLNYLYVLGNAADKAGNTELQDRALSRFVELGQNTAEYHLLMGKAFLNREENDKALAELQQAAQSDPNLPFVHFNLGLVFLARLDFDRAKEQFEKDIALEPDVPFNYDRLGLVYIYQQQDPKAEENFREALRRDSHLSSSYFGLARVYQREKKFDQALAAIDSAIKIDPDNPNYHNSKGQILLREGHTQDGQAELAAATRLLNASRARRQTELSGEALPQPELTAEPKP